MTTLTYTGTIAGRTTTSRRRPLLVSLAAVALLIGVTSGLAYSQAAASSTSEQASDVEAWTQMTAPASRKTRCMMPPAWRRACEE